MSNRWKRLTGWGVCERSERSQNYHWADRNGRMYLCGCFPSFRIGKEIKIPGGNRHRSTQMMTLRRYA